MNTTETNTELKKKKIHIHFYLYQNLGIVFSTVIEKDWSIAHGLSLFS